MLITILDVTKAKNKSIILITEKENINMKACCACLTLTPIILTNLVFPVPIFLLINIPLAKTFFCFRKLRNMELSLTPANQLLFFSNPIG